SLHPRPSPRRTALRPMNDVEVDVVDTETLQALLDFGDRVARAWVELRRDEHLIARHAAVLQCPADTLFVAVSLCSVHVAVAEFESVAHGIDTLRSVGPLPHAEPEYRDSIPVAQVEMFGLDVGVIGHERSPSSRFGLATELPPEALRTHPFAN